jgi:2-polyprenyl-3-methyl-5-hydroxy-6-metoxy-1,4-benzoquinol methylase
MPFENRSYDFVWNIGVVEHYSTEDMATIFAEMFRVCNSGGQVGVGIPNFRSLPIFKARILKMPFLRFIPGYRLDTETKYSEEQLVATLKEGAEKAGREIQDIKVTYFGSPLFMETPKWILLTLGKVVEILFPKTKFLIFLICVVK